MGVRLDKVKGEWEAFKYELKHGSDRGLLHNYVDFWVEMNRHMPYTKGHVEAVLVPVVIGVIVWLSL